MALFDLDPLLNAMLDTAPGISDLNLSVGRPPQVEIDGALRPVSFSGLPKLLPYHTELIMLRLLQGDVGSGKTVVALLAMARAVEAGGQAALMAPTEILARQHFATIQPLAAKAGLSVAILTGREKGRERRHGERGAHEGDGKDHPPPRGERSHPGGEGRAPRPRGTDPRDPSNRAARGRARRD